MRKISLFVLIIIICSVLTSFTTTAMSLASPSDDEIEATLKAIMMKDEIFEQTEKTRTPMKDLLDLLSRFKNWAWEKVKGLFDNISLDYSIDEKKLEKAKWILYVFLTAVVATGIWYGIYFYKKLFIKNKSLNLENEEILEEIRDYKKLEMLGDKAFDEGEYASAVRYFYLSLLIWFNERNIIMIDKAKTNKQYLKEIEFYFPELINDMKEFTKVFNKAWYGKQKITFESAQHWINVYQRIVREIVYEKE